MNKKGVLSAGILLIAIIFSLSLFPFALKHDNIADSKEDTHSPYNNPINPIHVNIPENIRPISIPSSAHILPQPRVISSSPAYNPPVQTPPSPPAPLPLPDLSQVLAGNSLIGMLPADATILLKTYHYNVNDRAWDDTYILKKGSITKGTASADIALILDSNYARQMNNQNLCDVVKAAKNAGSLGMEFYVSQIFLTWKYRSLASQRACFGM